MKFNHIEGRFLISNNETTIASLAVEAPAIGRLFVMAHAAFERENAVEYSSATFFLSLDGVPSDISHSVSTGTKRYVPYSANNVTLVAGFENVSMGAHTVTLTGASEIWRRGWIVDPQLTVLFSDEDLTP